MSRKTKDRCGHIYADLTMCQSIFLYASSMCCKKHFTDIECSTKSSDLQNKRLNKIRKIIKDHKNIESTIEQIKKELGFFLE